MFNWMNRRFYHFLKMWLMVMGMMLAALACIGLFMLLLSYVDSIWGGKGVFATFFITLVLALSVVMSWWGSESLYREELEEQRRVEKSLKKDWTK